MKIKLLGSHANYDKGSIIDAAVSTDRQWATFYWPNSTLTYGLFEDSFILVEESIADVPEENIGVSIKELFGQDLNELTVRFK